MDNNEILILEKKAIESYYDTIKSVETEELINELNIRGLSHISEVDAVLSKISIVEFNLNVSCPYIEVVLDLSSKVDETFEGYYKLLLNFNHEYIDDYLYWD